MNAHAEASMTPSDLASALSRSRTPTPRYDVVIIGGGINGAGVFRDLSLQGVDCLLVDSGDFCAGASAAPSRLIHGGIKYLETGEFRLVAQSTLERNLLLRNAPHYVKPIETVLPIKSWFGGIAPSVIRFFGGTAKLRDRGVLISKVGLELFDFFGRRRRVMPRHSVMFGDALHNAFPDMADDIVAAATYFDARVTHAERLGIELLLDGIAANPRSLAINHCAVTGTRGASIRFRDLVGDREYFATADVIVNASGAWIDRVNAALGVQSRYIGGAKGSHLILDNPALLKALGGKMVYFGASDGRVGLLYPFLGHVLVGSTDAPIADPDLALCEDDERDYMLGIVREIFPRLALSAEQVKYVYCGVRPLPKSDAADPGAVSRDHSIAEDRLPETGAPIYSLIGGKWTTFRRFAEEASDRALATLGNSRKLSTEGTSIGGGRGYPQNPTERQGFLEKLSALAIDSERAPTLIDRYGSRALEIARACAEGHDQPLRSLPDYSTAEIRFLFRNEIVGRLADVLFRRTDISLSIRLTRAVAREIAEIGAEALGWSARRVTFELSHVADLAWRCHRVADFDPSRAAAADGHATENVREEEP